MRTSPLPENAAWRHSILRCRFPARRLSAQIFAPKTFIRARRSKISILIHCGRLLPSNTAAQPATRARVTGIRLIFFVVERKQDPIVPFIARGWHLARKLDVASAIETARAFLFRDAFLTSPVSPLYVFGRREDVVVQKARSTINERVHARFWLTPFTFEGRRIWIGQVSRDIGVRLTGQTWNLTTHKIGPDVDFDRSYLLQDLFMSGFVERYGYVDGVGI